MSRRILNHSRYGELCAGALPKVIANQREFDRMAQTLERLAFRPDPSPEETALAELLARLVQDYDDRRHPLPKLPPHAMIRFLMEQRGLRQADLLPVFGSRSVASDVLSGKAQPTAFARSGGRTGRKAG